MTMRDHLSELRTAVAGRDFITGDDATKILDAMAVMQAELEVLLERLQIAEGRLAPEASGPQRVVKRKRA